MASAEPFYIIQFQTKISGILPNNSELILVYMNYRENAPQRQPSYEIPNKEDLESVRAVYRTIKLIDKSSYKDHFTKGELEDLERGHFTIEGLGIQQGNKYESFGTGFTNHMTISIDDDLQGRKLSTALIQGMMSGIKEEGVILVDDQKLFIDSDFSDGFWDKLKMKENPRGSKWSGPREEGNGYEKMITIKDIRKDLRSDRSNSPRRNNGKSNSRRRGGKRNIKKKSTRKR
jgi:hypothetical protein